MTSRRTIFRSLLAAVLPWGKGKAETVEPHVLKYSGQLEFDGLMRQFHRMQEVARIRAITWKCYGIPAPCPHSD